MIERATTITRNSVPQRGWAVGYLRTASVVSGSPASRAWIVMCSAPWYWKTRRTSGDAAHDEQVADEDQDPDQALDEVLGEAVVRSCWRSPTAMNRGSRKKTPTPATRVSAEHQGDGPAAELDALVGGRQRARCGPASGCR